MSRYGFLHVCMLICGLSISGCGDGRSKPSVLSSPRNAEMQADDLAVAGNTPNDSKAEQLPQKIHAHHLPNAIRIHEKVISGNGDDLFRFTRKL